MSICLKCKDKFTSKKYIHVQANKQAYSDDQGITNLLTIECHYMETLIDYRTHFELILVGILKENWVFNRQNQIFKLSTCGHKMIGLFQVRKDECLIFKKTVFHERNLSTCCS